METGRLGYPQEAGRFGAAVTTWIVCVGGDGRTGCLREEDFGAAAGTELAELLGHGRRALEGFQCARRVFFRDEQVAELHVRVHLGAAIAQRLDQL